jgi:hypothetical protein
MKIPYFLPSDQIVRNWTCPDKHNAEKAALISKNQIYITEYIHDTILHSADKKKKETTNRNIGSQPRGG